jgi:hypothetical protein
MELFPLEEGSFHSREHGFRIRNPGKEPDPGCASKLDLSLMPTEFPDDGTIDELLSLAGVSTEHSAARRWLESALAWTLSLGVMATLALYAISYAVWRLANARLLPI